MNKQTKTINKRKIKGVCVNIILVNRFRGTT